MSTKKEGSLLLCLKKSANSDELEVLLGLKYPKAHIGANTLNGAGGGIEDDETPEECAVRENSEEFGKQFIVLEEDLQSRGVVTFYKHDMKVMMKVHLFVSFKFEGLPKETKVMLSPSWYKVSQIPSLKMMPADKTFIPMIAEGKVIKDGWVRFNEKLDAVEEYYLPTR